MSVGAVGRNIICCVAIISLEYTIPPLIAEQAVNAGISASGSAHPQYP